MFSHWIGSWAQTNDKPLRQESLELRDQERCPFWWHLLVRLLWNMKPYP